MKEYPQSLRCSTAVLIVMGLICLIGPPALAVSYGVNLLVNGNAEQGSASSAGASVAIPGWTVTGAMSVVPYGAPQFPTASSPGPSDRMNQFFAGGDDGSSSAYQDIDVSGNATDINAGKVTCDLTGWLGGYLTDNDNAVFQVSFYQGDAKLSDGPIIGPVTAADRANATGLLYRYENGIPVPANTTSLRVTLTMTRATGSFNDGYADSLSLVLRAPIVVTTTADSGPGSLRAAITAGNRITFDPNLYATGAVIDLPTPLPTLVGGVSLIGPGANLLTIESSSSGYYGIFTVDNTSPQAGVSISGITIAKGGTGPYSAGGALIAGGVGAVTVSRCVFDHNLGMNGGAIANYSNLALNSCIFTNNSAQSAGGAIANVSGALTATSCLFKTNTAAYGGAIFNGAIVTLTGCLFTENTADNSGIVCNEVLSSAASLNLVNCTFSANSTPQADVYNASPSSAPSVAQVSIDSCTFVSTGAIYNDNKPSHPTGTVVTTITNSIFKTFTAGVNLGQAQAGGIISHGYNMSDDDGDGILTAPGDRANTDPMLGPLQDNGGPTLTHALLVGSLAIDKGNSSDVTDQRGAPRPVDDPNSINGGGNNSDIGAFEYQGVAPALLANISTRLSVQTGDNALIAGFIVTGYQPKKVIIRGLGPSLPLTGVLADPILQLNDGSGQLLETNDNWMDSSNKQAIIDSTIPPKNNLESAILRTLPAENAAYTAVLRGVNDGTGIGAVEVYDLDGMADSKLANISTRGLVQTGDNVLIGGFIVTGPNSQKVIIRAIGPSLPVDGKLADPTLELHDGNGALLETNDNWMDSPDKQAIIDSTIPPSNGLESAILQTLTPGNYTAIVGGANHGTGIGLVEVYALN
jgi:hypothetical protein